MRITTYCEFNTSLSTDNSEIDNWEDYVKYISGLLLSMKMKLYTIEL